MPRSLVSLLAGSPARAGSVIADLQKASILMGFCDLVSLFCEMKKASHIVLTGRWSAR